MERIISYTTEVYEKVSIDMLTGDEVRVGRQPYVEAGGVEYLAGNLSQRSYRNSTDGRTKIMADLPEQYATAIMAVWGEEPTVFEEDFHGTDN